MSGRLTVEELRSLVAAGEVDTVLLAFVDMQGRLQGKQLGAPYFLDDVLDHGAGACSYLLSVEVEMAPQEGLSTSSWETGHGDFQLLADVTTLRLAADHRVDARITSVWAAFDPHIPAGSALPGAVNRRIEDGGHFRILARPELLAIVDEVLAPAD